MTYGNVSTLTAVEDGKGVMPFGNAAFRFPLRPFMGMMGVAYASAPKLTSPNANSIPPTLGDGNIDISPLGPGSTVYLPVFADGALFYVGDPHMTMGDGEVALNDLNVAMRRAVVNALNFLEEGRGMDRATAYAYLSATADFAVFRWSTRPWVCTHALPSLTSANTFDGNCVTRSTPVVHPTDGTPAVMMASSWVASSPGSTAYCGGHADWQRLYLDSGDVLNEHRSAMT